MPVLIAQEMKFSIVTISHNQAPFLERALRSVIEQDYQNKEYIVVDPGSTDGSREIIERYRDRIDQILLQPDQGPADGLNKGFALATGEVYGFLNSDDVLYPGTLRKVAECFQQNPGVDVVSGDALVIDVNDQPIRRFYSDQFSLLRYAYNANTLVQQSTFFRKEKFWSAGGFNPDNRCAWDGEIFVAMGLAGARFATVHDGAWSGFRLHPQSITSSARLTECFQRHFQDSFEKIMGREFGVLDYPALWVMRLAKHILNPLGAVERLLKGPIYGREAGHTSG